MWVPVVRPSTITDRPFLLDTSTGVVHIVANLKESCVVQQENIRRLNFEMLVALDVNWIWHDACM